MFYFRDNLYQKEPVLTFCVQDGLAAIAKSYVRAIRPYSMV